MAAEVATSITSTALPDNEDLISFSFVSLAPQVALVSQSSAAVRSSAQDSVRKWARLLEYLYRYSWQRKGQIKKNEYAAVRRIRRGLSKRLH